MEARQEQAMNELKGLKAEFEKAAEDSRKVSFLQKWFKKPNPLQGQEYTILANHVNDAVEALVHYDELPEEKKAIRVIALRQHLTNLAGVSKGMASISKAQAAMSLFGRKHKAAEKFYKRASQKFAVVKDMI